MLGGWGLGLPLVKAAALAEEVEHLFEEGACLSAIVVVETDRNRAWAQFGVEGLGVPGPGQGIAGGGAVLDELDTFKDAEAVERLKDRSQLDGCIDGGVPGGEPFDLEAGGRPIWDIMVTPVLEKPGIMRNVEDTSWEWADESRLNLSSDLVAVMRRLQPTVQVAARM
ncbi:hypothetical protein H0H81_011483 [Sphagnurus paluster]|uniref:Uncharacterized protein n=1 Tax=Sphagnurus paluster TaxID=117069 RepID=A0A9P7FQY3_9AGAR|nr:hypothetical protein H0H81_011483 [Sphagnurus paluster]